MSGKPLQCLFQGDEERVQTGFAPGAAERPPRFHRSSLSHQQGQPPRGESGRAATRVFPERDQAGAGRTAFGIFIDAVVRGEKAENEVSRFLGGREREIRGFRQAFWSGDVRFQGGNGRFVSKRNDEAAQAARFPHFYARRVFQPVRRRTGQKATTGNPSSQARLAG
ncbi:hypothetical protein [Oxalobacter paraformigenes]|uniref:hypothetical protein n=1 Tax=Oxalobacter paraformigenes TaxID=556268 RepID=UPI00030946D5|nr:hypothetical protein [Oxalobacter paraformigenes]